MNIGINHIRTIERKVSFDLDKINLFIGDNGAGKSILGDFLELCSENMHFLGVNAMQFPVFTKFVGRQDWKSWSPNADVERPLLIERSIHFMGIPIQMRLLYSCTERFKQAENKNTICAEPLEFVVTYDNQALITWNDGERRVVLHVFVMLILEALRERPVPSAEELSDLLDIPYPEAKQFSLSLLKQFLLQGGKSFWDDQINPQIFLFDFQRLFQKGREADDYKRKWDPIVYFILGMVKRIHAAMLSFLVDTPVLKGKMEGRMIDYSKALRHDAAIDYFNIKFLEKKVLNEDGSIYDKRLLVDFHGKEVPYDELSDGYKAIYTRIDEWTEVVSQEPAVPAKSYFSNERVVIIRHPERDLSREQLENWARMITIGCLNCPNLRVIIETHSEEIYLSFLTHLTALGLMHMDIPIYKFIRYEFQDTVAPRYNYKCDGVGPYFKTGNQKIHPFEPAKVWSYSNHHFN